MDYKLGRVDSSNRSTVLVSLMVDQVESLRRKGVKSSVIISGSDLISQVSSIAGESNLYTDSLLFCAPEALVQPRWRAAAIVIDEAHCVSKW